MRPEKAYIPKFSKKSKFTLYLILTLIIQTSLYSICTFKIEIPSIFIKYVINYLGVSEQIQVDKVKYKFPNEIFIKKATMSNGTGIHSFKNIFLRLDSFFEKIIINNLKIEEINFNYLQNSLIIKDIISYKDEQNIISQFHINSEFCDINVKSILNEKKLIEYNTLQSQKTDHINFQRFFDNIKNYISNNIPSHKPKFFLLLSMDNYLALNFTQINKDSSNTIINGLSGFIHLNEFDLHVSEIKAKANNISISNSSNITRGNNIKFSYLNSDYIKNPNYNDEIKLSIQSIDVLGKFNGKIPPVTIRSYYKNNNRYINLFSNSNSTSVSNNIVIHRSKIHRISGFTSIIPKALNLKINAYGSNYNFLDGDRLMIKLFNHDTNPFSNVAYIKAKASNFTALQTPFADFNASGFIQKDLTLNINNVKCTMGESNVQGSYKQHWYPHRYEFILNGNLLPTNINNWFGEWWDKIWHDFKFDPTFPPFGNFIITGSWQKDSNHSTFGVINSKGFVYNNFFITESNLQISIDQNSTLIENINLNHPIGNLNGSISFFKNKNSKYNRFNYSLQGTLPVNDCKKVFGPVIETFLNDFNLSSVLITSKGQIPIELNEVNNTDSSNNFFTIDLFTEQEGSWKNIKFSNLKGNITSNFETIKFMFPFIDFANGRLTINLSINNINKLASLSFELINANIKNLYLSFLNFQGENGHNFVNSSNSDFISNNGTLDLKLNANGSLEDFSLFKGSGKISAYDKELSKLELLGFLSRGLSEIPIPLPTGTLNFNKLEGLFELEHNKLKFDQIVLSGLISKIENRGSFNFNNGELDIISKVQLMGNLPIPFIKQFAQFADPLSSFAEIKITGPWSDPQWKLLIKPLR